MEWKTDRGNEGNLMVNGRLKDEVGNGKRKMVGS